ncbi:MAG: S49 family peptidase [Hyphomonadaceae bacterium]
MKQFLITVGGVLAGLALFTFAIIFMLVGAISSIAAHKTPAPQRAVLELDLREPMTDQRAQNPLAALNRSSQSLLETLAKIDAARTDSSIKGIYVRANSAGMAASQAEEIRSALRAFRQSGKFVVAHLQNDGVRQSIAGYAAVAGADELWLQAASELQPMGLAAEMQFFADTLRRFHMRAEFVTREEYKTAPNILTQSDFTPAHREETLGLLNSLYGWMVRAIAADRKLSVQAARAAIEATPMTAQQAVAAKLVDRLGRPEDAEKAALDRAGEGAALLNMDEYQPRPPLSGPVIAVVGGEGDIVSGPQRVSPLSDGQVMNSDIVARALLDAADDDDVKASVFRVSSRGGSVVASDQILNALRTTRARGKKVVVSMGEYAASGGYYVAADADEILASATTITGSIGVFGGKIVIGPALDHYASVHSQTLSAGSPLVTMFSANEGFSDRERAAFTGTIDRAYQGFLALVAQGRGLTPAQTREIARGRVWTGEQAKERRLVDHIGGFQAALARARALGGVAADATVRLRYFPAEKSFPEQLQALFGGAADGAEGLATIALLTHDPRFVEALAALSAPEGQAAARAPLMEAR